MKRTFALAFAAFAAFAVCISARAENRKTLNGRAAAHIAAGTAPSHVRSMLGVPSWGGRGGSYTAFAASPHVEILARHYGWWGTERYYSGTRVVSTNRFALADWARKNGFSEYEISQACIGDVQISLVDNAIPDSCIPYFASDEILARRFGRPYGVQGWMSNQNGNLALNVSPVTFYDSWRSWMNATRYVAANRLHVRCDIVGAAAGRTYHDVHVGDSGHPVVLDIGAGRMVVCSDCSSATRGPPLTHPITIRIIQALAESVGDTLKIWDGN